MELVFRNILSVYFFYKILKHLFQVNNFDLELIYFLKLGISV